MARDNYQEITDRIATALEELAAGKRTLAPWQQPWSAKNAAGPIAPHNGHTGHVYRGVNLLMVWLSGFADARWYTFNQVAKNYPGSHVRKGERGTLVTFFQFVERKAGEKVQGEEETTSRSRRRPLLRTYTVFNHAQIEWAAGQEPGTPAAPVVEPETLHAEALAALAATGARVEHGGAAACYVPALDVIRMPPRATFTDEANYVATLAHEHVHWTGAATRKARNLTGRFGSDSYAAEELVAEIGAAFFCAEYGVPSLLDEQHLPYLGHWIKVLRGDKYAIFTAARLAREAVALLRGEGVADEAGETEAA